MMSEMEHGLAKGFQNQAQGIADHAQAIIDRKCDELAAAHREIARLRGELKTETGRRRFAELQLSRRN